MAKAKNINVTPSGAEWLCVAPNGDCTTWYPSREDCVNSGGRVVEGDQCPPLASTTSATEADRFTLEAAIMACWNTADDIELIASGAERGEDALLNALIGLKELHDRRVQRVFDIFEQLVKTRQL